MDLVMRTVGLRWMDRFLAAFKPDPTEDETSAEDVRARRAFIQDTIHAKPDSFISEQDVACMMYMYPGRF